MEQTRLIIAIALSFLVFLVWNYFFVDPAQMTPPPQATTQDGEPVTGEPVTPQASVQPAETAPLASPPETTAAPAPEHPPRIITVHAPLYSVNISETGAVFDSFTLTEYRETTEPDSPLKELIPAILPGGTVMAGFSGGSLENVNQATFSANIVEDIVEVIDAPREIRFTWTSPEGVSIEKAFTFSPNTYLIDLDISLQNATAAPIQGNLWLSLVNYAPEASRGYGFEGPSGLIDDSVEQIKIKNIEDQSVYPGTIRWIALQTQYFITSIIPPTPTKAEMKMIEQPNGVVENRFVNPLETIQPNTRLSHNFQLFFGPKSLKVLSQYGNGLDRLVNFGMFDFLGKPCLWLMNYLYSFIPNYGIAIIILTTIIKLLLWPLGNKSYKSMNEMKKIQPLMTEIREKYKNDKKKMNEELMGLYKIYKVNPVGGCLPMALQIPVFFALYRMLYESIELRHAPFVGWINDLSAPDRLFHFDFAIPLMQPPYGIPVLTIIMGGTMFLQQKMSPPPGDPTQAKMMMFMPIMFTVIFINFPAGLVLYWLVNNILSISQQYYISKKYA